MTYSRQITDFSHQVLTLHGFLLLILSDILLQIKLSAEFWHAVDDRLADVKSGQRHTTSPDGISVRWR